MAGDTISDTNPSGNSSGGVSQPHDSLVDLIQRFETRHAGHSGIQTNIEVSKAIGYLAINKNNPDYLAEYGPRLTAAYALQDIERISGPIKADPALRRDLDQLATTAPGLRNEPLQDILRSTPTLSDQKLVNDIRALAWEIRLDDDQTTHGVLHRIQNLKDKVPPAPKERRPSSSETVLNEVLGLAEPHDTPLIPPGSQKAPPSGTTNGGAQEQNLPRHQVGDDPGSWLNKRAQLDRDVSDQHNLTHEIEATFAQGQKSQEIKETIAGKLSFLPPEEHPAFISNIRATLGIPSRDTIGGDAKFQAWQTDRNSRLGVAAPPISNREHIEELRAELKNAAAADPAERTRILEELVSALDREPELKEAIGKGVSKAGGGETMSIQSNTAQTAPPAVEVPRRTDAADRAHDAPVPENAATTPNHEQSEPTHFTFSGPSGSLVNILAAMKKPKPAQPATPIGEQANINDRFGNFEKTRQQPRRDAIALQHAETSGTAAVRALEPINAENSAAQAVLAKIQDAVKDNQGGRSEVFSEMKPGGKFAGLREEFNAVLNNDKNKDFSASYHAAIDALAQYGKAGDAVSSLLQDPKHSAIAERLKKIDEKLGEAGAFLPSPEDGKSALDGLGEKFRSALDNIFNKIGKVFRRGEDAEAAARPSSSPSPGP